MNRLRLINYLNFYIKITHISVYKEYEILQTIIGSNSKGLIIDL
jgi:hypothetical protein